MALESDFHLGQRVRKNNDERQFRWVYAVIFMISLVAVLFRRITPWQRRGRAEEVPESIIAETKARTSKIVPFLFMG